MNRGAVYRRQKLYDKADPLLAECLSKKRSSLGDTHSFADCLSKTVATLGVDHPIELRIEYPIEDGEVDR
eukprot:gene29612-38734_t